MKLPHLILLSAAVLPACAPRSRAPSPPAREVESPSNAAAVDAAKAKVVATAAPKAAPGARVRGTVDFDGDGLADIVVSEAAGGDDRVLVYRGDKGGPSDPPSQVLSLSALKIAGSLTQVVHPGDVDGDGRSELLVVAEGKAHLLRGTPAGLAADVAQVLAPPDGDVHGVSFLALGDVDADGHADLGVSVACNPAVLESSPPIVIECSTDKHHFHAWAGTADGFDPTPRTDDAFAARLDTVPAIGLGDVNGDGFDDLLRQRAGRLLVFLGSDTGLAAKPAVELDPGKGEIMWFSASGDLDGDGTADFVVVPHGVDAGFARRALVYLGATTGPRARPSLVLQAPKGRAFYPYLADAASFADLDADGFADLTLPDQGAVIVYRGGAKGPQRKASAVLPAPTHEVNFGQVVSPGDTDGDGHDDLAVTSPFSGGLVEGKQMGRAHWYRGSATVAATSPDATLLAGRGRDGDVGLHAAGRSPR